eukprot:5935582-Pyramimonas_sp.AAC.1
MSWSMIDHSINHIRSVCKFVSPCVGAGVLRACVRGACASARFRHSSRASPCFGCPALLSDPAVPVILDHMIKYRSRPRLRSLCLRWMGSGFPEEAPEKQRLPFHLFILQP